MRREGGTTSKTIKQMEAATGVSLMVEGAIQVVGAVILQLNPMIRATLAGEITTNLSQTIKAVLVGEITTSPRRCQMTRATLLGTTTTSLNLSKTIKVVLGGEIMTSLRFSQMS